MPKLMFSNLKEFNKIMYDLELDLIIKDNKSATNKILSLITDRDKIKILSNKIEKVMKTLGEIEEKNWNGMWLRIIMNFFITASIEKVNLIVGNPPWVDWKNLPSKYRERIKELCIEKHLFSGDGRTGGINLNICALISNVVATKWLSDDGVMNFLMPKSLIHQQSYDGYRKFYLKENKRLYLKRIVDWTEAGHPFKPVQEKFLSYIFSLKKSNYAEGIEVKKYVIKKGENLNNSYQYEKFDEVASKFEIKKIYAGQVNNKNTIFVYAENKIELENFSRIAGEATYRGREGIEFYPQELFLLTELQREAPKGLKWVRNFQNSKSKYKIPLRDTLLETKYLHPLVKGTEISKYHLKKQNL